MRSPGCRSPPHPESARIQKTAEKVAARAEAIAAKRRATACPRWHVAQDEAGLPTLEWSFDQDVLDAEAKADGWYALITPLDAERATPAQILIQYNGQGAVERLKGPFAVTPVFVQRDRRAAALIWARTSRVAVSGLWPAGLSDVGVEEIEEAELGRHG
ncbi:hypothetical protein ACUN29_03825 [Streptomyces sp. WC2508]|uniref:hypothetical protein n=1 Tax=Streptomyces sp. WC2508 TaxID=3461405 RepID=UPI004044FEE8